MARNYGIAYCQHVLSQLQEIEDKLFSETGFGFDKFGREATTERQYRRLLDKFKKEKELGLSPSYRPDIHGEK